MAQSKDFRISLADVLFDIAGCTLVSIGVTCFSSPNNIAPGGVTGLSVMGNYLFGIPISVLTFGLNIPLLILAWRFLGHGFTLKTMKSVVVLTVMLQLVSMFMPVYRGNALLAAIYGGVLGGSGVAMVFMRSSTTGGTDIASRLLQLKFPAMSVGKLILCVDAFVLVTAAFVYQNIENALYGLISIFASTSLIDSLLYGLDTGRFMMIMTMRPDELSKAVIERLNRSCTLLEGKGSFTKREQPVVMCVVRKAQYFELKRIVHDIDPSAFMVALEASEVVGQGFKDIEASTKIS